MKKNLIFALAVAAMGLVGCSEDEWKSDWEDQPAPVLNGMYQIEKSYNPKTDVVFREYAGAYRVYETDGYIYTYNYSNPLQGIREQYKLMGNKLWTTGYPMDKDAYLWLKVTGTSSFASNNASNTNVTLYKTLDRHRYPWGVWQYKYVYDGEDKKWYYCSKPAAPETDMIAMFQDTYYSFYTNRDPDEYKMSNVLATSETEGSFYIGEEQLCYEYLEFGSTGEWGLMMWSPASGNGWFLTRQYTESYDFRSAH